MSETSTGAPSSRAHLILASQSPRRIELMRALRAIVHDNADVDHALAIVGE